MMSWCLRKLHDELVFKKITLSWCLRKLHDELVFKKIT